MSNVPTVAHLVRRYLAPTETFVYNQIRSLTRYQATILCHHLAEEAPPSPALKLRSLTDGLRPIPRWIDGVCYRAARALPSFSADLLARWIAEDNARLLHFHYLVDARFFLGLKTRTRLPTVVSAYGYDVSSFPRRFRGYGRRYLQPVFREVDCVLAMSEDMKKGLINLGCPAEKIVVHYHGIPVGRFAWPERSYPEKRPVDILLTGTLEVKKAQHLVLRALRMLEQQSGGPLERSPGDRLEPQSGHRLEQGPGDRLKQPSEGSPGFRVTLVGDGPLRPTLEAMVREFGWESRVRFLGRVPHASTLLIETYREADVFALPSQTVEGDKEGIPGTLVEAMASGLPVVSTVHAGIPEVVENGVNGLLVDEGDLSGLAEALGRLIRDRGLREHLGRAAAHTALSRCRLEEKTMELEEIYDSVLHRGRP